MATAEDWLEIYERTEYDFNQLSNDISVCTRERPLTSWQRKNFQKKCMCVLPSSFNVFYFILFLYFVDHICLYVNLYVINSG